MNNTFVKAAGGCSAPPSSYDRSDVTQLGSIKGGIDQILNPKVPVVARFRLIHPNASGMQFDQFNRSYIQPHYVHTIGAQFNGKTLFTVETNFSLSQDPVLGFNFQPEMDGDLTIYALDSKNKRFERSWPGERNKSQLAKVNQIVALHVCCTTHCCNKPGQCLPVSGSQQSVVRRTTRIRNSAAWIQPALSPAVPRVF